MGLTGDPSELCYLTSDGPRLGPRGWQPGQVPATLSCSRGPAATLPSALRGCPGAWLLPTLRAAVGEPPAPAEHLLLGELRAMPLTRFPWLPLLVMPVGPSWLWSPGPPQGLELGRGHALPPSVPPTRSSLSLLVFCHPEEAQLWRVPSFASSPQPASPLSCGRCSGQVLRVRGTSLLPTL